MYAADDQTETQTGIVVSGTGQVAVAPEIATLEVGVSLTSLDLAQARDDAATKIGAATRYLLGAGVAESDINTTRLNVHTSFDHRNHDGRDPGGRALDSGAPERGVRQPTHHLSSGIRATIRDLDSAQSIVNDLFTEIGDGLTMNGLTFGVEDQTTGRAEAIELAFEDARDKAVQLARLAGLSLGPVLAISESSGRFEAQPMAAMSRMSGGEIPLSAGELDQQATITVRWALGK